MSTSKTRLVACPNCKSLSEFSPNNAFRPFCSERCKLIDLGVWATEGYAIPEPIKPEDLTDDIENQLLGH
jgi:endogenous inhibitor of DNA gyrase (YacG/DUF329 family)